MHITKRSDRAFLTGNKQTGRDEKGILRHLAKFPQLLKVNGMMMVSAIRQAHSHNSLCGLHASLLPTTLTSNTLIQLYTFFLLFDAFSYICMFSCSHIKPNQKIYVTFTCIHDANKKYVYTTKHVYLPSFIVHSSHFC